MFQKRFVFLLVICPALLGSMSCYGQRFEVGAGVGAMNYTGDLSRNVNIRHFRPGGEVFGRYNMKNGLSVRAGFLGGGIAAADRNADNEYQRLRDLSFRTLILEPSLQLEYNFLDYLEVRRAINWTPYVYGGIGYTFFNPKPNQGGYRTSGVVLPFGIGVKYQFNRPWSLGVSFGARKTFTDYLDGFGAEQVQPDKYQNGNPALKDMYYFLGIQLSYTFYRIVCP